MVNSLWVLTYMLPLGNICEWLLMIVTMDNLLAYLNNKTTRDQNIFAADCGTTIGYLRKACSIGSKFKPELCVIIEKVTNGQVTRKDLRPDDWHLIWPELVKEENDGTEEAA